MIDTATARTQPTVAPGTVVVVENGKGLFGQDLLNGRHRLVADEPRAAGGGTPVPIPTNSCS
jgi:putative redox protein